MQSGPSDHDFEPGAFGSGLESRPWFEVVVSFEAISPADAETVVDAMVLAACRGAGEGDDHECKFSAVASMRLIPIEELEGDESDT